MIGTVEFGHVALPIERIYLEGGEFHIQAQARGPLEIDDQSPAAVRGADGKLVYVGGSKFATPLKVRARDVVVVTINVGIEHIRPLGERKRSFR